MSWVCSNLYCFDAQDGAGKATQVNLVVERLNREGFPTKKLSFPRYETPTGQLVYDYLHGRFGDPHQLDSWIASMIFALDRKAAIPDIKNLTKGGIGILDRYVSSNLAHQGGKILDQVKREELIDGLLRLEYDIFGLPEPYLTIILGVSPEISFESVKKRALESGRSVDGHEMNFEHIQAAADVYRWLTERRPTFYRMVECCENGQLLSIPEIHEKIWTEFGPVFKGEKFRE